MLPGSVIVQGTLVFEMNLVLLIGVTGSVDPIGELWCLPFLNLALHIARGGSSALSSASTPAAIALRRTHFTASEETRGSPEKRHRERADRHCNLSKRTSAHSVDRPGSSPCETARPGRSRYTGYPIFYQKAPRLIQQPVTMSALGTATKPTTRGQPETKSAFLTPTRTEVRQIPPRSIFAPSSSH